MRTMTGKGVAAQTGTKRSGASAGLMLVGVVCALALPSAVLAFSSGFDAKSQLSTAGETIGTITPSTSEPRLARSINVGSLARGQLYRFTPAGTSMRPGRSVTVAVRVDADVAQAITVRASLASVTSAAVITPAPIPVRIAPNAYDLGVSRGYHGFAQGIVLPVERRKLDLPDMSAFKLGKGATPSDARFAPRIVLDERQNAGRAPRTFAGEGESMVDVGGSYRVTGNLNVTAGVRYSERQRDRLAPLTDGKKDGQAVYVGTQFRF